MVEHQILDLRVGGSSPPPVAFFMKAYKLMRVLKNGDITSLFINKQKRIKLNEWMTARCYPTKGFAFRFGFHTLPAPFAPHLSKDGRAWFEVEIEDFRPFSRPRTQGGKWYLSKKMKVVKKLNDAEVNKIVDRYACIF